MFKFIVGCMIILGLGGCDASTSQVTGKYVLPSELSNCKVYEMEGKNISHDLVIVHCPNAQTTTSYTVQQGKYNYPVNTTVIDN